MPFKYQDQEYSKTSLRQVAFKSIRRSQRREDDAGDDMKAETRGSTEVTGSIVTSTDIVAIAAERTTGRGEVETTKAPFPHGTMAGGIGTGAEVAMQNVKGDTNVRMPRAAGVAARITDGGAGPGTDMVTGTAANLRTAGGALARIADKVKNKGPMYRHRVHLYSLLC